MSTDVELAVQHVLLDADGVLQHPAGGNSVAALRPLLGDAAGEFLRASWALEAPSLRGEGDFVQVFADDVAARGLDVDVDALYDAAWTRIEVVPQSMELVARLKAAGYVVHLGTNQHRQRAEVMRTELGYDELFGVSVYSWELGVAKPDPAYFTRAAELVGVEPGRILFIDDVEANVRGAREAGLRAEQWQVDLDADDRDLPRLVALMARHGISLDA